MEAENLDRYPWSGPHRVRFDGGLCGRDGGGAYAERVNQDKYYLLQGLQRDGFISKSGQLTLQLGSAGSARRILRAQITSEQRRVEGTRPEIGLVLFPPFHHQEIHQVAGRSVKQIRNQAVHSLAPHRFARYRR